MHYRILFSRRCRLPFIDLPSFMIAINHSFDKTWSSIKEEILNRIGFIGVRPH